MREVKPFQCDQCGPVNHVIFDGYFVAERLLENIPFRITRYTDGSYVAETPENSRSYMLGLNEAHWMSQVAEKSTTWDIFECPKCHGDLGHFYDQDGHPWDGPPPHGT